MMTHQKILGEAFVLTKQSHIRVSSITEPIGCHLIFKAVTGGRFGGKNKINSCSLTIH